MRFSLRWLFIAILFAAIGIVALLYANEYWAGAARSATFLIVPLSMVGAIASTGATRMYWAGFAILSATQFWSLGLARGKADGYLLVEQGIEWLHPKILREVTIEVPFSGYGQPPPGNTVPRLVKLPHIDFFRVVAQCLLCGMSGLLGGYVAVWLHSRQVPHPARSDNERDNAPAHT